LVYEGWPLITRYSRCFNCLYNAYVCFIFLLTLTFKAFTKPNQINPPNSNDLSVNITDKWHIYSFKIQL